jgi:hypothetical protein
MTIPTDATPDADAPPFEDEADAARTDVPETVTVTNEPSITVTS